MTKSQGVTAALAAVLSLGAGQAALAHTPYLLPNAFDAERDHVTLEGSLTEDAYFSPDIALKTTSYVETLPDGRSQAIAPAAMLKDLALVEAPLDASGTYRFSTGQFIARANKMALIDGKWVMVRPAGESERHGPDHASGADAGHDGGKHGDHTHGDGPHGVSEADLPAGARTMLTGGVLTAETYVSKGAPTQAALATSGKGLELKPVTHPNAIYVDQGFAFKFLLDGAPAAGVPISVYRSGDAYDDKKITAEVKTDASGAAKVGFERPGVYLLTAHYPAGRAEGDAPVARSYVYSLTFEVTR
ncbi:MAG: DUF4198 domain-containing protein [Caulobacteraceae bacterium]